MVIQMNRPYENAPSVILEIVKGTTACSSTVFYGLLAWADLRAHNSKDPLIKLLSKHRRSIIQSTSDFT